LLLQEQLIEGQGRGVWTRQLARGSRRVVTWGRTLSFTSIVRWPKISRLCCTTRAGTQRPVHPLPPCRPSRRRDSILSCTSWTTPSGVPVCPDANTGRLSRRVLSLDPPIGFGLATSASVRSCRAYGGRDGTDSARCRSTRGIGPRRRVPDPGRRPRPTIAGLERPSIRRGSGDRRPRPTTSPCRTAPFHGPG
jgi:hypothetical protein